MSAQPHTQSSTSSGYTLGPDAPPWLEALCSAPKPPRDGDVAPGQSYADKLAELRSTMAGLSAPEGQAVPWRDVARAATSLLQQHKDIKVACYLVLAQSHLGGVSDCATALGGLHTLLCAHWATMTPPLERERARLAALVWLHEELAHVLRSPNNVAQGTAVSADATREALMQTAAQLDGTVQRLFTLAAPSFAELTRLLPVGTPRPTKPRPLAHATPTLPTQGTTTPIPSDPAATTLPQAAQLDAWGELLLRQADAHLATNSTHEGALRMRRQGLWLHIGHAPETVQGNTRIAPLPEELTKKLQQLEQDALWPELLRASEVSMMRNRLHLCLQHTSARALSHMGEAGVIAAQGIASETLSLVARLPGLLGSNASNGAALVDAATRTWLQTAAAPVSPTGHPNFARAAAPSARAQALLPNQDLVSGQPEAAATPRALFLARLRQAEELAATTPSQMAYAALSALGRVARSQQLQHWEPELTVRIDAAKIKALSLLPPSPKKARRIACALKRMAAVDLTRAHQLDLTLMPQGVL